MPIPQGIWDLLLANTAASGQSQNPYALGGAASKATGGGLDAAIAEAKSRLAGGALPQDPSSASLLQAQQPDAPVSAGVGTPPGGPPSSEITASMGGQFGMPGGALGSLAGGVGQFGLGMLGATAPVPFTAPITMAQIAQMIANFAGVGKANLNDPLAVGVPDPVNSPVPLSPPLAPTAMGGPSSNPSIGVSVDVGSGNFGPRGAEDSGGGSSGGASAGAGAPGSGPGAGEGAGGQAPYRGGYLKGPRTKKRKVPEAHGGEFVMNATASDKYGPLLEEINRKNPPDHDLDKLMDKARKFFDV